MKSINTLILKLLPCYKRNMNKAYIVGDSYLNPSDKFIYLVKLVLSPRTTDKMVFENMKALGSPKSIKDVSLEKLNKWEIKGFKTLKDRIINIYQNWDVYKDYKTLEDLTKIKGVGRKIASIYLNSVYGEPRVAIDTHIFQFIRKYFGIKTNDQVYGEEIIKQSCDKKYHILLHNILYRVNKFRCSGGLDYCEECDKILKNYNL